MKVKQAPSDFIVEELTDIIGGDAGDFGFYRLSKSGWTTPDALAAIRRQWDIPLDRMSYGGLKDRHAETTQYLSIWRGPQQNLEQPRIHLEYLGRIRRPYSSPEIRANRFTITLRSLAETRSLEAAATEIAACGVPNYFDDQRFGSVDRGGPFIALEMIRGHFEEALKLALAAPYEYDRAEQKHEKATLRQHWGDWDACKKHLERSHARSMVDFLRQRPGDFKGAVARLRPELSGLYLSAYQSHAWNRMLALWLETRLPSESRLGLELKLGTYPAPQVPLDWESLQVPLPSARLKLEESSEWRPIIDDVLAADGLTLATMRIPGLQKPYFSRGERAGCLKPEGLRMDMGKDELNAGRLKVQMKFDLLRGCYATMIVKRLVTSAR